MPAVNARKPATNRPANRAARRATSPRRPAARPVADTLRALARVACAEGQRLTDDGPRNVVAEVALSFTAGRVSWRQIVDAAVACSALAELAAHGAERTGEHGTHHAYPIAHARGYARCALDLLDALAERFDLPDGSSPIGPDEDGLRMIDVDAAGDVDLGAEVSR